MYNNFEEIVKGFTEEEAIQEAKRCLNCKTRPCAVKGCPANVKIPEFIQAILNKDYGLAYELINENNCFPSVTGRVCPQEYQCEGKCVRGIKATPIKIGMLERFVGDYCVDKIINNKKYNNKKIAIIGSGPAGLSCAKKLSLNGYDVTVFDNKEVFGGVLSYGIPKFRLPQHIVLKYIQQLKIYGVKFDNVTDISLKNIKKMGFLAIFLATGVGVSKNINIKNEHLKGIFNANDILYNVNLNKENSFNKNELPKKVLVIGGGNVAMDVARCCKKIGVEQVQIVYRRFEENMPARKDEIEHTKKDGVIFKTASKPISFISNPEDYVTGVQCVEMEILNQNGKNVLVEKANSNFIIESDNIIVAIGNKPDINISNEFGVKVDENNNILINKENFETSVEGIFAGGDVVTGAKTVILAIEAGNKAGQAIMNFLNKK